MIVLLSADSDQLVINKSGQQEREWLRSVADQKRCVLTSGFILNTWTRWLGRDVASHGWRMSTDRMVNDCLRQEELIILFSRFEIS